MLAFVWTYLYLHRKYVSSQDAAEYEIFVILE